MAETFGEADVIIRARLDELNKDLADSERLIDQSTERVTQAQVRAQQEVSAATEEASNSGYRQGVMLGFVTSHFRLFRRGVMASIKAIAMIPIVAKAASVALVGLTTGGIAVVALGLGLIMEKALQAERGMERLTDAADRLDGSRERVREFADVLARVPLLGRLAATAFLALNGETEAAQESYARMVATIEDGEVKVGMLGRAVNGLVNAIPHVGFARMLGFDTDFVAGIEKANEKIREMNALMAVQKNTVTIDRQVVGEAEGFSRGAARDKELVGLEGVERVRALERHRHEDAMRQLDEQERRRNEMHSAQVTGIREAMEAEEISRRAGNTMIAMLEENHRQRVETIQQEREQGERDLNAAMEERVRIAQQEADEQEKLARMQERRAEAARQNEKGRLIGGAASTRLQAAGRDFDAQRVDLIMQRREALRRIEVEGNEDLLAETEQYYDARADLINRREEEQLARDKEMAEKRAEAERKTMERERERQEQEEFDTQQKNDQLRSQILQARMRQQGMEVEAQQEAIRQRYQQMIDQMEREGNRVGADLARDLRDLEIEAAGQQDRGRQAEFQQITLSRFAPGMGQDDKIERDQLSALAKIERNTRNERPAVAV